MLAFGLKTVWFILSLTGLVSSWLYLCAFGRVVGFKWAPLLYSIGATLVQGMFCIGVIYKFNPLNMPIAFCYVQSILSAFGKLLNTGVVVALTRATSMAVSKPKTWSDAERALKWRWPLGLPVIGLPAVGTMTYAVLAIKLKAIHQSDGMWCEATAPQWIRLFNASAFPIPWAILVIYLSIVSLRSIRETERHLLRSRPDILEDPSPRSRSRGFSLRDALPGAKMMELSRKESATSGGKQSRERKRSMATMNDVRGSQHGQGQAFCMPFGRSSKSADGHGFMQPNAARGASHNRAPSTSSSHISIPEGDDASLEMSIDILAFNNGSSTTVQLAEQLDGKSPTDLVVSTSVEVVSEDGDSHHTGNMVEHIPDAEVTHTVELVRVLSRSTGPEDEESKKGAENWVDDDCVKEAKIEDVDVEYARRTRNLEQFGILEDGADADIVDERPRLSPAGPRPTSMSFTPHGLYKKPKRPPAVLSPAIWYIIIFQLAFSFIQIIAFFTPFVDVVSRKPLPSHFGTQHVALLLSGWAPTFVFGCIRAVRQNLIPWRPVSQDDLTQV